jgi:outer membrane protein assembly factor BamE (lipoprotein component of BamABCDE complex)
VAEKKTPQSTGPSPYEQDKLQLRIVPDEPTVQDLGQGMTDQEIQEFLGAPIVADNKEESSG